jgi:spore coat protein A, manganese oxidase
MRSTMKRRTFVSYCGTTLALFGYGPGGSKQALAQIPGGTLDPASVPKYVTPLLVPPVMPRAARRLLAGGKNADYYEISMKQFAQQILPAGLPSTTVWGYGPVRAEDRRALMVHNAPSLTIEAKWNTPVIVKWINDLKDGNGRFLPHLLPVDQTLHWANPPGGADGRDSRPVFAATPGRYLGPVPMVTHVHGAVGVGDESDGYAEAWVLPAAKDIPAGHATRGRWYDFFAAKAATKYGLSWGPGYATHHYPNSQRAGTIWYHDHTLGMTRLNVYAGPAGFYLVRGGPAGDNAVIDRRSGQPAELPGPAPREGDAFPPNKPYREIAIALQDRSFNADGSLFYPDTRAFFDGVAGPYLPTTDIAPLWNPEFFGNMMMVNGNTWPFLEVEQRRYRLRFLNGCQSRFLILDFGAIAGIEVWQIGNEGGFLGDVVNISANHANRLLLGPAERADVIVDFAHVPLGHHVLANSGPDEPFGGEVPEDSVADPASTGQVMQFRVMPSFEADTSTPPPFLVLPPLPVLPAPTRTRRLALLEEMSEFFDDAPAETLLGNVGANGVWTPRAWADPVSENPALGATEVWEFYNATGDAHPMHVHEAAFQVINRQALVVDETHRKVHPNGPLLPPEPWENGFKDTVIAYPEQVTRIRLRFGSPGQFVWHCHIVEHEDNEMMRPYRVGPVQPGQPE